MSTPLKVLLVDDEPDLLELIQLYLQNAGLEVITALGGEEALRTLETAAVDAVVSDYQMPGMDGIALLKNVRAAHGSLPFILFTGKGREEVAMEALNAGVSFYVQKGGSMNAQVAELAHKVRTSVAHRQAEKELRESEARFKDLFDSVADAIFIIGMKGRFREVNKRACERLGYSREELLSIGPDDIDDPAFAHLMQQRKEETASKGALVFETVHVTKEGRKIPTEISSRMVHYLGEPAVLSVARDLTERNMAESELKRREEESNQLIEEMLSAFSVMEPIKDASGNVVDLTLLRANREFERLTGAPRDMITGRRISEMADTPHAFWFELVRKVGVTGEPERFLKFVGTKGRWYEGAAYMTTDGKVAISFNDVTERIITERTLADTVRKMATLNDITRHDILNQLTIISTRLELARKKFEGPDFEAFADVIGRSVESINTQIRFLRDYELIGEKRPVWQSVRDASAKAVQAALSRGMRVDVQAGGHEVLADPMLSKVFDNLVDNSLRHGERVTRIGIRVEEGDELRIIYEDDGVGIDAKDRGNLFQKGFGKHTGLGLFLISEILSISDMTIAEEGAPGKGAFFIITVPPGGHRTA